MIIITGKICNHKLILNSFIVLSFIVLSFISIYILYKSHSMHIGYDTNFHFKRILELNESINNGNIIPDYSFNEFHGSSVMILYPYLNLLPAALLSILTGYNIRLIYLFFIFNTFITFIISFYSSKSYINDYSISYIFSVIYGLLNTLLGYYFLIGDFGIIYSYMFIPIAIFGFLKVIQGRNGYILLSLGMTLVLYSHILNFIILGILLLTMILINIKKLHKQVIINFMKSIILFIALTCIIWLPLLSFYFNNIGNINIPSSIQLNKISIRNFVKGIYGSKSWNTLGTFPIISIIVSLFFYSKFSRYLQQLYFLSILIILSVLFLPWKNITSYGIFNVLNQFQFTNRFFIIPQIILSFTFSIIISRYINNHLIRKLVYCLVIFISISLQLIPGQYALKNNLSNSRSIHKYFEYKHNNQIMNTDIVNHKIDDSSGFNLFINSYDHESNDYIPKSAKAVSSYINQNIGFYNNAYSIKFNHVTYNTLTFTSNNNFNTLSLPIYMYNNEKLRVYLNNRLVNNYADKNGLLTINNIKNNIKSRNKIYIKPILNPFRITGAILSIFGWLFTLGIIIRRKLLHQYKLNK